MLFRCGLCLSLLLLHAFYLGLLSLKFLVSSHDPLNFSCQNFLMIALLLFLLYGCFFIFFTFFVRVDVPFPSLVNNLFLLELKSGDSSPESSTNSTKSENRNEKTETAAKEKPSKKNRKKEKEVAESVPVKTKKEKRLLVLPFELSIMGILLLIVLGGFYVVSHQFFVFI